MQAKEMLILLSLPDSRDNNPYQARLEEEAKKIVDQTGIHLEVYFAEGDARGQRQFIGDLIAKRHVNAVICMPADEKTVESKVREALAADIPFWMLNRNPVYLEELRKNSNGTPLAVVTPDQLKVGEIQAEQVFRLLGEKGTAMYIKGSSQNWSSAQRSVGMLRRLPALSSKIKLIEINGDWSSRKAYDALRTWYGVLKEHYPNNQRAVIAAMPELIVLQSEGMYTGARLAFDEFAKDLNAPHLARLPIIGCDGTPDFIKKVGQGEIFGTIKLPTTSDVALKAVIEWLDKRKHPELFTVLKPEPYPDLDRLRPIKEAGAA